ncbi:MAG: MoxR family ATPase [Lachnospira sp.]|nr:MoxR family ATPase [Lachnospira sp.]
MSDKKVLKIKENVEKVIVGKSDVIDYVMVALLSEGHILLEDVPGTGKTMLAKTFAKSVGVKFARIQFTADMLPSDITGLKFYDRKMGEFVFRQGPIFAGIVLADEINRATPKTQSALLESMEERQVTVDGETRKLEEPFIVIATDNPIETVGTFPLPEAQLDRFLMKVSMGYPTNEEELEIVDRFFEKSPFDSVNSVCEGTDIIAMRQDARNVYVHPVLRQYVVNLVEATRNHNFVEVGASPRATLALMRAIRAYAYIKGRDYCVPEDVRCMAVPVLAHRLKMRARNITGGATGAEVIKELLETIPVPTEEWER